MRNNQKLVVYVWPHKQKEKDGKQPLYVRITVDGKPTSFATRFFVNPLHWNKNNQCLKLNAPSSQNINAFLDRMRNSLNQDFMNCIARGLRIDSKTLKNNFLGIEEETVQERTLLMAVNYHNDKFKELVISGQAVHSTWKKYNTTKNKVVDFLKDRYKVKDIALTEMKYSFVTDFEHYLFTEARLQTNTVSKTIKQLKKIMRICVDNDWLEVNPIDRFKCAYKSPDRVVLDARELDQLANTILLNKTFDEIRDVFVFCCYTGFAYSDVFKFKRSDISIGIDGDYWIITHRQKTGERESVPLLPKALDILKKYENHSQCLKRNKLLPVRTNQVYNNYLKDVANRCGIEKNLTSHIARHTFATTVTLSNGVPIETVSKMLGHTKLATTQIYAKVLDHKISHDMKMLRDKLHPKEEVRIKKSKS